MMAAALFNTVYHYFYAPGLPWSVLPLLVYTTGSAIVAPGATLLVLDLFPHIRGTVASCQSFVLTMLAALMAGVVSPLISHSTLLLALGQLSLVSVSLLLWAIARHLTRR
jgi:DHA1 family bicyclomycin/chloramphenicol resistance-like MFS transporter